MEGLINCDVNLMRIFNPDATLYYEKFIEN
jgi:hypothetical protein